MADVASSSVVSLNSISDHFSLSFLQGEDISLRIKKLAYSFFSENYLHDIKLSKDGDIICVDAKCFRSMKQSEPPHRLVIKISSVSITDASCTCTAGWVTIVVIYYLDIYSLYRFDKR